MKFSEEHYYSHSADAVYALFTDAKEIKAKQKALEARKIRIEECDTNDGGAIVRFVREMPAEVPGILSKFLQPWNTVEQSEQWVCYEDGTFTADLAIDIANVPVTVSGTLELEPTEDGCINHIRMRVDSGIPFVGSTLADYVAKDCRRIIDLEYEYISERLGAG
jgi:hypothetical protein